MSVDKRKTKVSKVENSVAENLKKSEEFKIKVKVEGEKIFKELLPRKIVELAEMMESEKMSISRLEEMRVALNIPIPPTPIINYTNNNNPPNLKKRKADHLDEDDNVIGTKVYSLPGGVVSVNKELCEVIEVIKPEALQLVQVANKLKMWITFQIPKIEDGNNFGVSIQEDTLSEVRQVESEAATYLDQISRYHLTRGKMVAKVAKYPHVEDFRRTVQEIDEKEFISLRLILTELRNNYASLHDLIGKNLDKIRKPRSANTDNMY